MPTINMDNVQILNTVRQYAPFDYQNRVPAVTQGNVESALRAFQTYTPDWDTFMGVFLQKIGLQVVRKAQFTSPFSPFKMSPMRLGSKIEEVAINLQRAHAYKNNNYDVFSGDLPDTRVSYHSMNYHVYYSCQAPLEDVLRQAAIDNYFLAQYLGSLLDNLITSDQADEYVATKNLLGEYATNEGFYNVQVSDVLTAVDKAAASRELVSRMRAMYRKVKFPSSNYSPEGRNAGLTTVGGDVVLIMTADVESVIDVESLAAAFHMEKADFLADSVVIIDDWPREFANSGVQALMVDRDFFMITDNLYTTQAAPINVANLSQTWYLHHWMTLSYSRFVPAISFTTAASTSLPATPAEVTELTIAPVDSTAINAITDQTQMVPPNDELFTVGD